MRKFFSQLAIYKNECSNKLSLDYILASTARRIVKIFSANLKNLKIFYRIFGFLKRKKIYETSYLKFIIKISAFKYAIRFFKKR